jgi:hypothetical protein
MMKNLDCLKEHARARYIEKMCKSELQDSTFKVLLTFILAANEDGMVKGQLKDILRDLNISRSTHTRALSALEGCSLVKRLAGGFFLPDLAHSYAHVLAKLDFTPEPPDASPVSQNVCTDDAPHHYKENKNNYIKNLKEKGGSSVSHARPNKSAIDKLKSLARSEANRIRGAVFGERMGIFEHPTTCRFLEGYGGIDGLRQMSEKNARFRLSTHQLTKVFLALAGENQSVEGSAIVEANHIGRAIFNGTPLESSHPATHAFLREHGGVDGLRKQSRTTVVFLLSTYQITHFFREFEEDYKGLDTHSKSAVQNNGTNVRSKILVTQGHEEWPKVSASTLQLSKEIANGILIHRSESCVN